MGPGVVESRSNQASERENGGGFWPSRAVISWACAIDVAVETRARSSAVGVGSAVEVGIIAELLSNLLLRSSSTLKTRNDDPFSWICRLDDVEVEGGPHSILAPVESVRDEELMPRCCEPASPSPSKHASSSSRLGGSRDLTAQLYPPLCTLLDLIPVPKNRLPLFVSEDSGLISSRSSPSRHIRSPEEETVSGDRLRENSPNMGSVKVISVIGSSLGSGDRGCPL